MIVEVYQKVWNRCMSKFNTMSRALNSSVFLYNASMSLTASGRKVKDHCHAYQKIRKDTRRIYESQFASQTSSRIRGVDPGSLGGVLTLNPHKIRMFWPGLELAGGCPPTGFLCPPSLLFVFLASPRGTENVPGTAGAHLVWTVKLHNEWQQQQAHRDSLQLKGRHL